LALFQDNVAYNESIQICKTVFFNLFSGAKINRFQYFGSDKIFRKLDTILNRIAV